MPTKQTLGLNQTIGQFLAQQQLRYVKLLECNAQELEEAVDKELEENPALEGSDVPVPAVESPAYRQFSRRQSQQEPESFEFTPPDLDESLYDFLNRQLSEKSLPKKTEDAARFIIGSLDSNGYLRRSLPEIMNDLTFGPGIEISAEEAEEALHAVQSLEPAGVGATSLQETLLLQLRRKAPSPVVENAIRIIDRQFDAFTKKHSHRLISALKLSQQEVDDAIELIRSLNPKPGGAVGGDAEPSDVIIPDFIVSIDDGELSITLNNRIPELRIEQSFESAMADLRTLDRNKRKGHEFVMSRYKDAEEFIRILSQRQQTMAAVMTAIVSLQKDYFLSGDVYDLKPMKIKDVASITGLDLSVISRATNNKYVATPTGTFPLRFFFSGDKGSADSEEQVTNRKVEAELRKIIDGEDKKHPMSDEKLQQEMTARGYNLKRRTIAKYRDRLGIPVARLRKI